MSTTVAALLPAYNEEKTIAGVLSVVLATPAVDQVFVISDGSVDGTVREALRFPEVAVIDILLNRGKGGAVKAGLDHCLAEVILILDADLLGLQPEHIDILLEPVLSGKAVMSTGIFESGRAATDLAQRVAPFLSGQRAMRRELLTAISDLDLSRFGIEVALHRHVEEEGLAAVEVQLSDLSHVMKEEKLGFWRGALARLKMYLEIVIYLLGLAGKRGKGPESQ